MLTYFDIIGIYDDVMLTYFVIICVYMYIYDDDVMLTFGLSGSL